jgi:signal transduction histidine kinase
VPPPRSIDPPPPPRLSAWSIIWRYSLVALAGAALLLATSSALLSPPTEVGSGHAVAILSVDLVVGLLALVVMGFRRRWPLGVVVVLTAMICVSAFAAAPWAVAVVSLATRRRWREVLAVGVASLVAQLVYGIVNPFAGRGVPWWVAYALGVLSFGVLVMIGFYIGARRELLANLQARAETAEREQAMRVAQERTRIAREMHDVLAHRISLVAMHAGALTFRDDLTRDETRRAAQVIQDGARRALSDLREVLGVLRDPTMGEDECRQPQPTLRDLPSLVAEAVEGGMRVDLVEGIPAGDVVPDATGRTVYRMTQEALTNARKHAPGMPVTVVLTGASGGLLVLEVRNPMPVRVPVGVAVGRAVEPLPGAGMGLIGLAERAVLADGYLEHGVTPGREFLVRARLPWPA